MTLLLSAQLLGCSGSESDGNPAAGQPPGVSADAQPRVSPSPDADPASGQTATSSEASTTGLQDSDDLVPDSEANREPHLKMNLQDGVKREFDNGPTPEEIARFRKRLEKKPKTKRVQGSGHTAPVFDTEMVEPTK